MEFSRDLVCWILCVCFCLTFCEGALRFCSATDDIKNGSTLNAEVNKPLTFSIRVCFGAQEVFSRNVYIYRQGQPLGWFSDTTERYIKVNITTTAQSALVKLTLPETLLRDFTNHFSFILTTIDKYYRTTLSELTLVFLVNLQGTTIMTAASRTRQLSTTPTTVTTRTSAETTSTTSSTCTTPTVDMPDCPSPMYIVEGGRCLQFIQWDGSSSPDIQCQKLNGESSSETTISGIVKCQTEIPELKILVSLDYYIDSTNGRQQIRSKYDNSRFDIGCAFYREILRSPKISSFYISINSEKTILLNNSQHYLPVKPNTRNINLICVAAGFPKPQFKISHWEIIQGEIKQYGSKLDYIWSLEAKCENSGIYTCVVNSSLGSDKISATLQFTYPASINTFVIRDKLSREVSSFYKNESATLLCEASGRLSLGPTLFFDNECGLLTSASQSTNWTEYKMSSVACSDMGRYYCKIQDENYKMQERMTELRVWGCAPQLCSHEQQNNTITSIINQTVQISVCLMSSSAPSYPDKTSRTSVTFMKHENSLIFFEVNISIDNIQTSDSGQKTIKLRNYYGELTYTFFVKVQDTVAQEQDQTSEAGFNPLYVGLPVGLVVLALIIGVVVYQIKKKQPRNAGTQNLNFNNYLNDESQVTYANIQDFRNEDANVCGPVSDKAEIETCQYNNLTPDNTDLDTGRTVTEDGLVYLSLANTSKSSTKMSSLDKPSSLRVTSKPRPEEFVEYTTLDLQKTGQITLPEDDKVDEELDVYECQDICVEDLAE